MVISEALPPSYDTLKTLTVATVTNALQITTDTLITQILREERQKENQYSMAALFAKPRRSLAKTTNSIPYSNSNPNSKSNHLKSKKGKPCPHCTNLKCMRIGHTIECCWAEGSSLEGQQPVIPRNSQPRNTSLAKDSGKKDGKVAVLIAQDCATLTEHGHSHSFEWVVDSGASSHICANHDWFSSYSILNPPHPIILGDKHTIHAISQGQIDISVCDDSDNWHATVQDVLHCPDIGINLLSISHLTDVNLELQFTKDQCFLLNPNDQSIGIALQTNRFS